MTTNDLVKLAPNLDESEAVKLCADLYGLKAQVDALPSERDQNFRVMANDGSRYVLKIANARESSAILELQNSAMQYVRDKISAISGEEEPANNLCPEPVSSLRGETIIRHQLENGQHHFVRLLTYLPGWPLARIQPHSADLQRDLGAFFGRLDKILAGFQHEAADREFYWDLKNAGEVVGSYRELLSGEQREMVDHYFDRYQSQVAPVLDTFRHSVIHGDGNDYNVLVELDDGWTPAVSGVIDFGDMVYSHTVNEVAIAAAYAMLDKADPLAVAAEVIAGYHGEYPLTETELDVLFDLICMRLCTSVCVAAHQQALAPENDYLTITQEPAWRLLGQLRDVHAMYSRGVLRGACGLAPFPQAAALPDWLAENRALMAPVVPFDLTSPETLVLDLSVGSLLLASADLGAGTSRLAHLIEGEMAANDAAIAVGRYDEARLLYRTDQFACASDELPERRTVHLGIDLFAAAGTSVHTPLAATVESIQDNNDPLDYGPTLILRHESPNGPFYTLYGHLDRASLSRCSVGQRLAPGEPIGAIGDVAVNGGWPPHLHFQIIADLLGEVGNFPGVASPSERHVWTNLCPDPNLILGTPDTCFPRREHPETEIVDRRQRQLGKSLSLSYQRPLHIVRGWRQNLYDIDGRAYLDVVNNVCHVGHCHPHVVQAGQRHMAVLNTNTRYLHGNIVDYAQRLLAKFPDPLNVVFFVCSGSEANELALRLARIYTGRSDILMLDAAYHGNTQALIDISPYKHDGRGGSGSPDWAHKVLMPDPYRGLYRGDGAEIGAAYALHVEEAIVRSLAKGRQAPAAFIAESVLGCGGQIVLPDTYLAEAYRYVRAAAGLCIADEVQVGFGRVGTHFWGFETQDVVPDIVTMGKPIGNGHPLAAVVTTTEIADAFANGMEYFNTFGGNPVSCAIGMAVLDVIEDEGLQENARLAGQRLQDGLRELAEDHALLGDVRGLGLFVGVELVLDPGTREPAAEHAAYIAERMRDHGILISTDGPDHNVLKMKPPIVFDEQDADRLVETLGRVMQESCLRVRH